MGLLSRFTIERELLIGRVILLHTLGARTQEAQDISKATQLWMPEEGIGGNSLERDACPCKASNTNDKTSLVEGGVYFSLSK